MHVCYLEGVVHSDVPTEKFFTAHIFSVSVCSRLIDVPNLQYTLIVCRFFAFAVTFWAGWCGSRGYLPLFGYAKNAMMLQQERIADCRASGVERQQLEVLGVRTCLFECWIRRRGNNNSGQKCYCLQAALDSSRLHEWKHFKHENTSAPPPPRKQQPPEMLKEICWCLEAKIKEEIKDCLNSPCTTVIQILRYVSTRGLAGNQQRERGVSLRSCWDQSRAKNKECVVTLKANEVEPSAGRSGLFHYKPRERVNWPAGTDSSTKSDWIKILRRGWGAGGDRWRITGEGNTAGLTRLMKDSWRGKETENRWAGKRV